MIAILTLIIAVPLGFLIRNRIACYLTYAVIFAHIFTFQTANLLIEWVNGSREAFAATGAPLSYLAVTTAIYAAGFGLVTLGYWIRKRRDAARSAVRLDSPIA